MTLRTWDIVPETEGWAILMNGRRFACYPSLHMAMDAVTRNTGETEAKIVRRLGADGNFYDAETGLLLSPDAGWRDRH